MLMPLALRRAAQASPAYASAAGSYSDHYPLWLIDHRPCLPSVMVEALQQRGAQTRLEITMLDYEIHKTDEATPRYYAEIFNAVTTDTVHITGNYPTARHANDAANAWIRCCELFVADATGPTT